MVAFVSEVVHEEKTNHDQPKDQQNMVNFHGNLLLKNTFKGAAQREIVTLHLAEQGGTGQQRSRLARPTPPHKH